ncbi:MAG TPA: ABC transporter substrate-binding protein [Nocardiopsis listeri]|uniref:ABC transporter substrate-binding protein n=1 Tax=Nocardiopsis listeri TaxID=53440 RepID=UPI001D86BF2C|nr:ABC transporter substrate-binding protein [Nocardiopsis listeri]HJE60013.1 ABC transporter substrate-binding protein [Nocardiopsis listeri]
MTYQLPRRDMFKLAGGAFAGAWLLTGCGSSGGGSSSGIEYWGAFPTPETEEYFRSQFIDTFNESTSYSVSMSTKQLTDLASLTDTAVSSGNAPDIIYSPGPSTSVNYAQGLKTLELDDYATEYGWEDRLLPWATQLSRVDDRLHSVPTSYGSMVLYYNRTVFEDNGWTPPTTKAEFEDLCEEADSKGMIPVGAGNSGYPAQSEWYLTCLLNAGLGPHFLYDVLTGDRDWSDPAVVDLIQSMKSQLDKGWWGGGADRYFTNTDPDMCTGLATGDVAMYMSGTWSFASMGSFFTDSGNDPQDWDWAPLPSLADGVDPGVFPLAIGTALSIDSGSTDPDAAAAFLDHIMGDTTRSLEYLAEQGENPPPVAYEPTDFPEGTDPRVQRLYEQIPESENLGYASWTFLPPETNTALYTEFDKVITGDMSPKEYTEILDSTFHQELGAGAAPAPFTPQ